MPKPCTAKVGTYQGKKFLQVLDAMGPGLQVLWCPLHESIPGNERANDLAESATAMAESKVRSEAAPKTQSQGSL